MTNPPLLPFYTTPFGLGINSTAYTDALKAPYYNSTHWPLNLTLFTGTDDNRGSTINGAIGIRVIGPNHDRFCNPMSESKSDYIPEIVGINDTVEGKTVFPYEAVASAFGVDGEYDSEDIPQCTMKIECLDCDGKVMSIVDAPSNSNRRLLNPV